MAKKETKVTDITKTGPQSYRDLQRENAAAFNTAKANSSLAGLVGDSPKVRSIDMVYEGQEHSPLQMQTGGEDYWGKSMFDPTSVGAEDYNNLTDIRAENQPWYAQIAAGLTKGVLLAGTTFLDGIVGLIIGGGQAIGEQRFSALWDNPFSDLMQEINDLSEEALPNYYTQKELNSPWYENIFSANFIGDKFIKNLGFSVGALYSGQVMTAPFKLPKVIKWINAIGRSAKATPIVKTATGAFFSAVNEGRVEANINARKEFFEPEKRKLDEIYDERLANEFQPLFDAVQAEYEANRGKQLVQGKNPDGTTSVYDPAVAEYDKKMQQLREQLENRRNAREQDPFYIESLAKINEDRLHMGNMDLLVNLPILTASNIIQFAKFYSKGFDTARRSVKVAQRAGQYVPKSTKVGAAWAATKGALSEGWEEISQRGGAEWARDYYSTDVSNFIKKKQDTNAEQETLSFIKSFANSVNTTLNEGGAWEEFFIGALTGFMGVPMFRSPRGANGKFRSPIGIEGGVYEHVKEYREKRAREEVVAAKLNEIIQRPEFLNYYRGMIRHRSYQDDMDRAVEEGNKFDFKNAELAQFISDINMFDNAGRLDELVAMIDAAYDTSDENLQAIIDNTTSTTEDGRKIGPYIDENGNEMTATEEGKKQMIESLGKARDDMHKNINRYIEAKKKIDLSTKEVLDDSQLEELTWMNVQIQDWQDRIKELGKDSRESLKKLNEHLSSKIEALQAIISEKIAGEATEETNENSEQKNTESTQENTEAPKTATVNNQEQITKLNKKINRLNKELNNKKKKPNKKRAKTIRESIASLQKQIDDLKKQTTETAQTTETTQETTKPAPKRDTRDLGLLQKTLKRYKQYQESLNKILETTEEKALNILSDPDPRMGRYVDNLITMINRNLKDAFSEEERSSLVEKLTDIRKLGKAKALYQERAGQYIADSALQKIDHKLAEEVQLQRAKAIKGQDLKTRLSKATKVSEFKDIYDNEEDQEIKDGIVDSMVAEGNAVAKNFKELSQYNKEIREAISNAAAVEENASELEEDATTLWEEHVKNAENVAQASNGNSVYLNNTDFFEDDATGERHQKARGVIEKALQKVAETRRRAAEAAPRVEEPGGSNDNTDTGNNDHTEGGEAAPTGNNTDSEVGELLPIGDDDISDIIDENLNINNEANQQDNSRGKRKYYRPVIPKFHIEASKEGDFRDFDVVVKEKEGLDFSGIYGYLRDNGAFEYVDSGQLKVGDEIGFMIDPSFNDHTIFIVTDRGQVIGSIDESETSLSRYEGLQELVNRVRREYQEYNNKNNKNKKGPGRRSYREAFNSVGAKIDGGITVNWEGIDPGVYKTATRYFRAKLAQKLKWFREKISDPLPAYLQGVLNQAGIDVQFSNPENLGKILKAFNENKLTLAETMAYIEAITMFPEKDAYHEAFMSRMDEDKSAEPKKLEHRISITHSSVEESTIFGDIDLLLDSEMAGSQIADFQMNAKGSKSSITLASQYNNGKIEDFYVEHDGISEIVVFTRDNGEEIGDRGGGLAVHIWRALTSTEVEKITKLVKSFGGNHQELAEAIDKIMHEKPKRRRTRRIKAKLGAEYFINEGYKQLRTIQKVVDKLNALQKEDPLGILNLAETIAKNYFVDGKFDTINGPAQILKLKTKVQEYLGDLYNYILMDQYGRFSIHPFGLSKSYPKELGAIFISSEGNLYSLKENPYEITGANVRTARSANSKKGLMYYDLLKDQRLSIGGANRAESKLQNQEVTVYGTELYNIHEKGFKYDVVQQSDYEGIPEGRLKVIINGAAIYTDSNGEVNYIISAYNDNNYVALFRVPETNMWSIKMQNPRGSKSDIKHRLETVFSLLPSNARLYEKTSVSVDALRVYAQQLSRGFKVGESTEDTYTTHLNGADKNNVFNDTEEHRQNMDMLSATEDQLDQIKEILAPYLEALGVKNIDNVVKLDKFGNIELTLPVLIKTDGTVNPFYKNDPSVETTIEKEIEEEETEEEVEDTETAQEESTQDNSNKKFFATPRSRVSKIMVGRVPYSSEEQNLNETPGVNDSDSTPMFGIIKNGRMHTRNKIPANKIRNPRSMRNKEGRLYLLIPDASGMYTPVAVRVKHLNTQEFDLDSSSIADTQIGKKILEAFEALARATDNSTVAAAMEKLGKVLYIGDVMVNYFNSNAGSGITISRKVRNEEDGSFVTYKDSNGVEHVREAKTNIYFQTKKNTVNVNGLEVDTAIAEQSGIDTSSAGQPKETSQILQEIKQAFYNMNLPLQVNAKEINDPAYNKLLISSGILTSNLTQARVLGSWFTTDYFDDQGNLHTAENPTAPATRNTGQNPVGGTPTVVPGTRVIYPSGNVRYVELAPEHSSKPIIRDIKGNDITNALNENERRLAIDMAMAQDHYGDAREGSMMTDNKVVTADGLVLDRDTGKYLTGNAADAIKNKLQLRNQADEARKAEANRVVAEIEENQKKVDKERTDGEYYYVLEEDGEYHQYDRVHSRLGDNWTGSRNNTNSDRALRAGTAIDQVIRDFFNNKDNATTKPEIMSQEAYEQLLNTLSEIKAKMEAQGERFLANNIVVFHKYNDGTRVAGELDILAIDKHGNFRIYDVKTSKYDFHGSFFEEKGNMQRMSTKDYYTLQLSAYQNLFESQYGVPIKDLAILPFKLTYSENDQVTKVESQGGIKLTYNPNTPVKKENTTTNDGGEYGSTDIPIFDKNIGETFDLEEDLSDDTMPWLSDVWQEGYYVKDGKVHKTYIDHLTEIDGEQVWAVAVPKRSEATSNAQGNGISRTENRTIGYTVYMVFNNGKTIEAYQHLSTDQATNFNPTTLIEAIQKKGVDWIKEQSSEETLLYKPENNAATDAEVGPVSNEEAAAAAKVAEEEGSINEEDEEFTDNDIDDLDDLFEDKDGFFTDPNYGTKKVEGLNVEIGKQYDVEFLKSLFTRFVNPKNKEIIALAERVFKVLDQLGISVTFSDSFDWGVKGFYRGSKTGGEISLSYKFFTTAFASDFLQDRKAQIILHEAIHAVTSYVLTPRMREKLTPELREAADEINDVYNNIKDNPELASEYGIKNAKEMIAEMSNIMFRNKLKKINIWQKLKNAIKKLFASKKTTAFDVLDKALDKVLDNFNIDLYNDYIGRRPYNSAMADPEWDFFQDIYTQEMDDILKNAPRNAEGKLLANNGEVSNLTEKQYAQVRTKAFKDWFGDWENNPKEASKVVDENGEPLVVYHRTPNKFTKFDKDFIGTTTDSGQYGKGFYFGLESNRGSGNNLIPSFLNIRNPYYITKASRTSVLAYLFKRDKSKYPMWADRFSTEEINDLNSKDGVIDKVEDYEFVIADPNQIKSATDNSGTFSTSENNIYDETSINNVPERVYHYSDNSELSFTRQEDNYFSTVKGGTKSAIFFTDNPNPTEGTVLDRDYKYSVRLDVDRVKVIYSTKASLHQTGTSFTEEINKAEKEGYDAVRFIGIDDNQEADQNITVVFDPSRVNIEDSNNRRTESKKIETFNQLDATTRTNLEKQGWTEKEFNHISQEEKDYAIRCAAL